MVTHENWGGGPLNPYWPGHFPRTLCVFVAVLETSSAMSLFPLGHMCSLVLNKAQSAAVMRSPGADFALREEVLVYSYLTLFLTSLFNGLLDPIDIMPLKLH